MVPLANIIKPEERDCAVLDVLREQKAIVEQNNRFEVIEIPAPQMQVRMTPDGDVVFLIQAIIPAEQLTKKPSKLMIGLGEAGQQAVHNYLKEEIGIICPQFKAYVNRGAVKTVQQTMDARKTKGKPTMAEPVDRTADLLKGITT